MFEMQRLLLARVEQQTTHGDNSVEAHNIPLIATSPHYIQGKGSALYWGYRPSPFIAHES